MPKKQLILKHAAIFVSYLIIVWGFYRFLFKLPDEVEELVVKPIVWLIPLIYFLGKEKLGISSIGFTFKNLFSSIYLSLGLGAIFVLEALLINFLRYKGFNFSANFGTVAFLSSFSLSFVTAFSEETVFRGYIFNRIWYVLKNEWNANLITSSLWALIHIPVTFFVWKLDPASAMIYLILTTIFGIGSAFVFARTRNILSSILLHVLWEWPIILFR